MNKLFKRIALPYKLLLLALIPLIFLIYFAYEIIVEKNERINIIYGALGDINKSLTIADYARQLHYERRMTTLFYLNKVTDAELIAQQAKSDTKSEILESNYRKGYDDFKKYTLVNNLPQIRDDILRKRISIDQALNSYTNLILRLHNSTNVSIENIPYLSSVSKEVVGQRLMSQLANYFGLVRAKIYIAAVTKSITPQDVNIIQRNAALVFSYWEEFRQRAPVNSVHAFDSVTTNTQYSYIWPVLQSAKDSGKVSIAIDPDNWWTSSGNYLDKLMTMQESLMQQTGTLANHIADKEKRELQLNLMLLIIIIVVVVSIVVFSILHISKILTELQLAAEKIAKGTTGIDLPVYTSDAIGSLAESINNIDDNNKTLTQAAEAIGRGDFSVDVKPRSSEDILGTAILKMKNDLQTFTEENDRKIWLQSGIALISESVLGDKDVNRVSTDSLTTLINYLNAQTGIFYTAENDTLKFETGYGIADMRSIPKQLNFGQTIVGETAVNKKPVLLKDIPETFLKISSASGETNPRNLLVVPLLYNNLVEGVIEIGSLNPFSEDALQLLKEVSTAIGIALFTAKNRARLQELFEETQAQSEELQAQHSELENINAELEAQTQKLQASEEELKVQQEELMQANQELEERSRLLEEKNQLIVERNLDIQKKADELEQSTRYKSEFLANMSHELRTPLNSILLLSRLLSENNLQNLTPDQVESANVIQNSGKGLLNLIDEILDLSKIESGKMELEYEPVEIQSIATNMRQLFAPIAREKNLDFNIIVDAGLPERFETDQQRLEQILKNLLSNALKFTARGSVFMGIRPSAFSDMLIEFYVKDTGVGIPADKQKVIFEAFQQADGSTRRKYGGTGLGLSISRQLAKLLGGDITVKSSAGTGSEFIVTVPKMRLDEVAENAAYEPEVEAVEEKNQPAKNFRVDRIPSDVDDDRANVQSADKIILIVEDDTAFAKSLLNFTHQKGYKGIVAVRGDLAVEMALKYKPVAILLDIQLPMKDGWEVMDELKGNNLLKHIPVHMMSSMEAKRESITRGAVDFINKPMALEQMQQVFKTLETALQQGPKKVMIVEENPRHAKALAYFLETFKINAEIKGSIKEGISALKEKDINCVILDMGIPDHNAYETLEQVKKNPGLENLPIIIFTGKNLSKSEEGRIKQYADSIVVKTAHSYQRILDEVGLFLHLVEEKKDDAKDKRNSQQKLGALSEVLKDKIVLVADDDVRNIYSLTKALEQHRMKVLSAIDGKEALKQLSENSKVDVILMDMMMPEMDGYETITQIRTNPKYKNLPILAVTAKAMVGDREKCIRAGASDYISKPVDIDQLTSLLRVWLYDKHN